MELFMKRLETHVATMVSQSSYALYSTLHVLLGRNGHSRRDHFPWRIQCPHTGPNYFGEYCYGRSRSPRWVGDVVARKNGAPTFRSSQHATHAIIQLVTADMQSLMSSATGGGIERPTSAPPPLDGTTANSRIGDLRPSQLLSVPTTLSAANSAVSSPVILGSPVSRAKGMQLGANKIPASVASAALAVQLADEVAAAEGVEGNPWGSDDLMDVNADDGDWSKSTRRGSLIRN